MSYRAALQRLLSLADFERATGVSKGRRDRNNLARMQRFLERLGNPHLGLPSIHVTGSKGKGSVAAMLSAILVACGFKTGLYTSPHLHTFRERIRVDGEPVTEETFAGLVDQLWPKVEGMRQEGPEAEVSTFELLTAMAFAHFRAVHCDFEVLEVGLGGRLDATNVIKAPRVCVLTSISLDHTEVLGSTVEEIARDKAGIIKPGTTVVCAPQPPGALTVIEEACRQQQAKLIKVGVVFRWDLVESDYTSQTALISSMDHDYRIRLPLLGTHQLENAACALAVAEELVRQGLSMPPQAVVEGLQRTQWPARLEVLQRSPLVVADGAHNPYAIRTVGTSLETYLPYHRLVLIIGMTAGHDAEGIATEAARLGPLAVVATRSRHPRALPVGDVERMFHERGVPVHQAATVAEALQKARALAGKSDLVLGTGSLFVAAELREAVKGIPPELYPELSAPRRAQRTV